MTLKLTPQQAQALFNIFNDMVLVTTPNGLNERLISRHMVNIYKKLRGKWEGEVKRSYKLTITPEEALAYRIYWRYNSLSDCPYEWSMIVTHCIQIDAELSKTATQINHTHKFLN